MDYEKALDKAYKDMPEVTAGEDRFDPPEFNVRVQGNSTLITNFESVAGELDRDKNQLMKYVMGEIGTAGHLENRRAKLKGQFPEKQIKKALDDYIEKYILCSECGKPDTDLKKQNGTLTLKCEACGAFTPL